MASDRLKLLFDDPDDVLELSTLAGLGLPYGNIARAGIITGVNCEAVLVIVDTGIYITCSRVQTIASPK